MSANRTILKRLLQDNQIEVRDGIIFDVPPDPLPAQFQFSYVEGMMLGLAIGDALGNTSESLTPRERYAKHGEITNYLPNRHANRSALGLPSDDSQLAFWTLEQMIADRHMNPEHIARRFSCQNIFGIGQSVRGFLRNYKGGKPWYDAAVKSAGNGAIMRIAPVVFPYLNSPSADLWVDTALLAAITHNDSAAIAASVAFVYLVWQLLGMTSPPDPWWYKEEFTKVIRDLEIRHDYRPRTPHITDYCGGLADYCEKLIDQAWTNNWSVVKACDYWYSGTYLLETIPSTLYILMKYGQDPEQAIIRAVNDTRDNDTIAAIVGTAMGALYGKEALPDRWLTDLSGRTGENDDGQMCRLLEQAKVLFWHATDCTAAVINCVKPCKQPCAIRNEGRR